MHYVGKLLRIQVKSNSRYTLNVRVGGQKCTSGSFEEESFLSLTGIEKRIMRENKSCMLV